MRLVGQRNNRIGVLALVAGVGLLQTTMVLGQSPAVQGEPIRLRDDLTFDTKVPVPAFTTQRPKVLWDRAHFNFLTISGRDRAFRELVTNDGYEVIASTEKFHSKMLAGYDIVFIGQASGGNTPETDAQPAFAPEECEALYSWVRSGGSLLLLADHYPADVAVNILANRFGMTFSKGWVSEKNDRHDDPAYNTGSSIMFSRENGLLRDHPIMNGRVAAERVNWLLTVYGSSLDGPSGSELLLIPPTASNVSMARGVEPAGLGRASAVAMTVANGRVAVFADSSMFTARIVERGKESHPDGMSRRDLDGRQLALNVMHWLSGLIK